MNIKNFFNELISCAIDIRFYVTKLAGENKNAFLYLLLIMLIFGSIDAVKFSLAANDVIDEIKTSYEKEFPDFKLTPEGLVFDVEMPFTLVTANKDELYIIDTTGATAKEVLDSYSEGVLVTKDKIYYKENSIEVTEYSISELYTIFKDFNKDTLKKIFDYSWVVYIFIFLGYFCYFYISKLFAGLIISLMMLIMNAILKGGKNFDAFFMTSLYAMTVPIALNTFQNISGINLPAGWFIFLLIPVIYMTLALKMSKDTSSETVDKKE